MSRHRNLPWKQQLYLAQFVSKAFILLHWLWNVWPSAQQRRLLAAQNEQSGCCHEAFTGNSGHARHRIILTLIRLSFPWKLVNIVISILTAWFSLKRLNWKCYEMIGSSISSLQAAEKEPFLESTLFGPLGVRKWRVWQNFCTSKTPKIGVNP